MRTVKILGVLALGIAILALALNYFVRAAGVTTISGYLILLDQKVSENDYLYLGEKEFSTIVYLPSSNAEGTVTYCSFVFPEGVNETADITKDGVIDYADAYLLSEAFGCKNTQQCWDERFNIWQCYFVFSGRRFKDPSGDCYINETDAQLISKHFGKTTNPSSSTCELEEACRADVNKDGVVNLFDSVIIGRNFNRYADEVSYYGNIKKGDTDLNGDGIINILDAVILGVNFGQSASQQKCFTSPLINLGNNKYRVSVRGRGLYYVGVSYRIALV